MAAQGGEDAAGEAVLGAAPAGAGRGERRRQWRRRGQPAAPPPRGERWVLGKFLPLQEGDRADWRVQTADLRVQYPPFLLAASASACTVPLNQRPTLWTQEILGSNLWAGSWRQGEGEVYGVQRTLGAACAAVGASRAPLWDAWSRVGLGRSSGCRGGSEAGVCVLLPRGQKPLVSSKA